MAGKRVSLFLKEISQVDNFGTKRFLYTAVNKQRYAYSQKTQNGPEFGLFFDIDGVIVRGREVLSGAKKAFQLLTDKDNKFWVPTVFVTNAGNCLRQKKANQLSNWLDMEIKAEQVLMSHSPLKCFRQYLDKHVLVSGQGPVKDIAKNLGFTKVTTIDTLREAFPTLDMVDHKRRKSAPCGFEQYFPRIEAVILFGEPVRWETNLQLIIDVLVTNGKPSGAPRQIVYPHIPVLACNMDLMWMAEAPMPRFAHGCFLHCLESLYQKVTGLELKYTALVGKPSEITYHHSEQVLQEQARMMGIRGIKRMYCIGDNPDADIYGANLYNRYLHSKIEKLTLLNQRVRRTSYGGQEYSEEMVTAMANPRMYHIEEQSGHLPHLGVEECSSLLVCTGVFHHERNYSNNRNLDDNNSNEDSNNNASQKQRTPGVSLLNHNHRDFILDQELTKPTIIVPNVYEAVLSVFMKEGVLTAGS